MTPNLIWGENLLCYNYNDVFELRNVINAIFNGDIGWHKVKNI